MKNALLILLGALLTGCATVKHSRCYNGVKTENGIVPIETVEIENSSWQLFKFITLGSGNPRHPNVCSCRWFTNTATLQNNMSMLDMEMKLVNADTIANLTSRPTEENFLFFVLTRYSYHTSAVLSRKPRASASTDLNRNN